MADFPFPSSFPTESSQMNVETTSATLKMDSSGVQVQGKLDTLPSKLADENQEMNAEERAVSFMLAIDSATTDSSASAVQNTETISASDAAGPVVNSDTNQPNASTNISADTQVSETFVYMTGCEDDGQTEDAEDDDENEDDDMSSEVSEGVDLQEELQEALDDSNFEISGSFYHGSLLTNPPNPCLFISGLGLVGLPLSDRDAKAIISCSTMAPFGQGERLVVNKDVRDTWEIEASRISFGNAAWHDYVNKTLCAQLCTSLGINVGANPPRMELYKLLLYETGSHFLPHQDTQKADGMFATAVIILPSAYTGGQVIVSHASESKTIDFAKDSLFSMALLAWYTDVKHEVKPVTSGYRLALSYNFIHVAPPGVPLPCLPEMQDTTNALKRVLRRWRDEKYESSPNFMAYLLDHQYTPANLTQGLKALKGVDLQRVSFVRPIAEELGFRVGIARLDHNVSGQGEDNGYNYHSRRRWYDDSDGDSDRETPDMYEVDSTSTTISGLVDLDGLPILSKGKIDVESECLIPNDPFEGESPDDTEYEGYMGNYPGQVEHWYRRTALVLIHDDRVDDICFSVEGAGYAFKKLQQSTTIPPTADDRRWANRLLQARYLAREHILALLDFALKWKDVTMWKTITSNPTCVLSMVDSSILFKGMETFSFEVARLSFETLLARSNILAERINFLSQVPAKASASDKDAVNAWYQREVAKILSSYKPTNAQDIPAILNIIRLFGLKAFESMVMTNVAKNKGNYAFCIAFMASLAENRQTLVEKESSRASSRDTNAIGDPSQSSSTPADTVNNLIRQCLQTALSQWNDVTVHTSRFAVYQQYGQPAINSSAAKVDRIIEIIEKAITLPDLDTCKTLFISILKAPGPTNTKFQEIYIPLIPRLRVLLAKKNLQLFQPPFVDFIQLVIGLYLRDILGKKGQLSNMHLRKIGCGCADCKMLDNFIFDYTKSTTVIRIVQARRLHLERQAAAARDLCTYQTIRSGSPHGIELKKLPAIIEASSWIARQKAAKTFLTSIGSDSDISRIMGNRYVDVKYALEGVKPFGSAQATTVSSASTIASVVPRTIATATMTNATNLNPVQHSIPNLGTRVTNVPTATSSSITDRAPKPSTSAAPPKLAGTKRKSQPKVHLGTIDLTED